MIFQRARLSLTKLVRESKENEYGTLHFLSSFQDLVSNETPHTTDGLQKIAWNQYHGVLALS